MDKIKSFFLDSYIISLLFKIIDDDKIISINNDIQDQLASQIKILSNEYLTEKGVSEVRIKSFNEETDFAKVEKEIQDFLTGEEYLEKLKFLSETFGKIYYEKLFPALSPEDQAKVIEYINLNQEALDIQAKNITTIKQAQKEVLEQYGVKSYEELKAKLGIEETANEVVSPTINLGGIKQDNTINPVREESSKVPVELVSAVPATVSEEPKVVLPETPIIPVEAKQSEVAESPLVGELPQEQKVEAPIITETPAIEAMQPVAQTPIVTEPVVEPDNSAVPKIETSSVSEAQPEAGKEVDTFDWASLIMDQIQNQNAPTAATPAQTNANAVAPVVEVPQVNPTIQVEPPKSEAPQTIVAAPVPQEVSVAQALPVQPAPVITPEVPEKPVVLPTSQSAQQPSAASKIDALGIDLNTQMPVAPQ